MPGDLPIEQARPCSCPASDKLARGRQDKGHAMPATAQTAIGAIGIDIGKNSFHIVGLDIIILVIGGSLWIMANLNHNMIPDLGKHGNAYEPTPKPSTCGVVDIT
jgi:hypothetical protein